MPHLTEANLAGVRGTPATDAELAARALSDELIAELRAADTIVIGAPMYNFSVATTLRAWFDHVLRAGETFRYTENGPEGLLGGKRVIVVESRGGLYSEGPAQAIDFQEPYLRHLLGFIGLTDVTFVRAEKIGYGPEARARRSQRATAALRQVAAAASPRRREPASRPSGHRRLVAAGRLSRRLHRLHRLLDGQELGGGAADTVPARATASAPAAIVSSSGASIRQTTSYLPKQKKKWCSLPPDRLDRAWRPPPCGRSGWRPSP